MAFEAPSPSDMREVASQLGLNLTDTDLGEFRELMSDVFAQLRSTLLITGRAGCRTQRHHAVVVSCQNAGVAAVKLHVR